MIGSFIVRRNLILVRLKSDCCVHPEGRGRSHLSSPLLPKGGTWGTGRRAAGCLSSAHPWVCVRGEPSILISRSCQTRPFQRMPKGRWTVFSLLLSNPAFRATGETAFRATLGCSILSLGSKIKLMKLQDKIFFRNTLTVFHAL